MLGTLAVTLNAVSLMSCGTIPGGGCRAASPSLARTIQPGQPACASVDSICSSDESAMLCFASAEVETCGVCVLVTWWGLLACQIPTSVLSPTTIANQTVGLFRFPRSVRFMQPTSLFGIFQFGIEMIVHLLPCQRAAVRRGESISSSHENESFAHNRHSLTLGYVLALLKSDSTQWTRDYKNQFRSHLGTYSRWRFRMEPQMSTPSSCNRLNARSA